MLAKVERRKRPRRYNNLNFSASQPCVLENIMVVEQHHQVGLRSKMAPRARAKEGFREAGDIAGSTVANLDEDVFFQLANKYWLKPSKKTTKVKVKPEILKTEIWDVLEKEDFAFRSLLALENLQLLERYALLQF